MESRDLRELRAAAWFAASGAWLAAMLLATAIALMVFVRVAPGIVVFFVGLAVGLLSVMAHYNVQRRASTPRTSSYGLN
jgi:sterol desaturase/sphingolipid hydroxylase (fatty acid hydroxylase superfamily)